MNKGMFFSALACLLGGLASLPALASGGRVVQLTAQEARATEGADTIPPIDPVPKKIKCQLGYAQHDCNAENSITNCSGAGASCSACRSPSAGVTDTVWSCKPFDEEWDCTPLAGAAGTYDCGTKWTGACRYVGTPPNGEWFCTHGSDTTAGCSKDIKDKCM